MNSSLLIPLIKYNPGKKMENIYRLYCDKVDNDKKIPFLNKSQILKSIKNLGKPNTIGLIINNNSNLFQEKRSRFFY